MPATGKRLLLLLVVALCYSTFAPIQAKLGDRVRHLRIPLDKAREVSKAAAEAAEREGKQARQAAAGGAAELEGEVSPRKSQLEATKASAGTGPDTRSDAQHRDPATQLNDAASVPSPREAPPPQWSIYERQIRAGRGQLQQFLLSLSGLSVGSSDVPPTPEQASQIAAHVASLRWPVPAASDQLPDHLAAGDDPGGRSARPEAEPAEPDVVPATRSRQGAGKHRADGAADIATLPASQRLQKHSRLVKAVWPDLSLDAEDAAGKSQREAHEQAAGDGAASLAGEEHQPTGSSDPPLHSTDQVASAQQEAGRVPVDEPATPATAVAPTRGILIAAGGTVLLTHVYITLSVLRNVLRCELPVHIIHNLPREMDKDTKDLLMERFAGVTIVDAASLPYPEHHQIVPVEHYVVKAYAFYHCPFDQVLVLDADNLPLADPTSLFDDPAFQQHGSLFWPDFGRDLPQSAYQMFGLHAPSTHGPDAVTQTDAGQFLLDRRRHADVIEWVWFLNSYGPGGIYQHTWSDKETYQLAFHLAGKPGDFQQVKQRPRSIMCRIGPDTEDDRRFMVTAAMQHAPDGVPLFAHRTGDGKVDPLTNWECTDMEYVSVPLNPERAARLFAPDRGQHSYADETGLLVDFTEMQVKIDESRHALERKPSKACMASSPLRFHLDCGYDFEGDSVPVPFVEFQDFEQPIVFGVIRAAERIYRTIRPIIRTGVMFGNTCATYSAEVGIQCQNLEEQMTAVRKAH